MDTDRELISPFQCYSQCVTLLY